MKKAGKQGKNFLVFNLFSCFFVLWSLIKLKNLHQIIQYIQEKLGNSPNVDPWSGVWFVISGTAVNADWGNVRVVIVQGAREKGDIYT